MKFGVREICDVVLKAKSTVTIGSHTFQKGEPVIYFDTAKTSAMESGATTVYAQGGRGNSRLIAWEGEKTLTFTMEDALISPKGLAILSGANLIQAGVDSKNQPVTVIAHTTETVAAVGNAAGASDTTVTITLSKEPVATQPVYVMVLDGNGEMSGVPMLINPASPIEGVELADNTITFTTANSKVIAHGDAVLVDYYVEYATDATQIDITPDQFAGYYYLEASTLFRRQSDGVDLPAEFIIPKVKIQSNFTFTMASSGDPSSFTFTMDAFPDYILGDTSKKQVLASIQILEADDNYDLTGGSAEELTEIKRFNYNEDNGSYLSRNKLTSDDTDVA